MIKKHKKIQFDTEVESAQPPFLCAFFIRTARAQFGHETVMDFLPEKYNLSTNKGKTRERKIFLMIFLLHPLFCLQTQTPQDFRDFKDMQIRERIDVILRFFMKNSITNKGKVVLCLYYQNCDFFRCLVLKL